MYSTGTNNSHFLTAPEWSTGTTTLEVGEDGEGKLMYKQSNLFCDVPKRCIKSVRGRKPVAAGW